MDLKKNPFANIFPSIEAAEKYVQRVQELGRTVFLHDIEGQEVDGGKGRGLLLNLTVEEVFGFTLCKNPTSFKTEKPTESALLYLGEDALETGQLEYNSIESLELVLFERLLLEEPSKHLTLLNKSSMPNNHILETKCLLYLFECFRRLLVKLQECNTSQRKNEQADFLDSLHTMMGYVIRNAATGLKQPDLYEKQNLHKQIIELLTPQYGSEMTEFLKYIAGEIYNEDGSNAVYSSFAPVLGIVQYDLEHSNILNYNMNELYVLLAFASVPKLTEVLMKQGRQWEPNSIGRSFTESALGAAMNISILPSNPYQQYEFFNKPRDVNMRIMEDQLWSATSALVTCLSKILLSALKSSKHTTLSWIGSCLDRNGARGRLSALDMFSPDTLQCASDGFMLNLCGALMHLTQKFTCPENASKLLSIDPTYPAAQMTADGSNGVHMQGLSSLTCLVPTEEGQTRPVASHFNFVTECFFLTHRAISLGPSVVQDKAQRVYQEIGMHQSRLEEQEMEQLMSGYLSLRCALIEPTFVSLQGFFIEATCSWLTQVVVDPPVSEDRNTYCPTQFRKITFPLPDTAPTTLRCIPELLVENVTHFLVAAKRFEVNGSGTGVLPYEIRLLDPILTYLLVFMNGAVRARNPHLRAQLAECLETILPRETVPTAINNFYKERVFKLHPHRFVIVESLLDVFVSIEMTGQSVTFEQKFNYRRPMYTVMEYLWDLEEQRQSFKKLASEAEANMEAINPPLFLRFINLLMNDAVFLLDEALSNMASLRTMQAAREPGGEWESLNPTERQRNETNFNHTGMNARFDNILGMKTIECLVYLSSEIKSIFCHPTLVDRIAAMLNYFLLHLVGPKRKEFKVRDQKEYQFDPAGLVHRICRIYIHLGTSDAFCSAVSRDGRSYSVQLFTDAENVLVRTGGTMLVTDLQETAAKVVRLANLQKEEDELLADIPDEFLDPIMSTLMSDPVLLPSSRQIVDRTTIARHLLSDQSDPFNREPLTMDMVKPADELRAQIDEWIAQRRATNTS